MAKKQKTINDLVNLLKEDGAIPEGAEDQGVKKGHNHIIVWYSDMGRYAGYFSDKRPFKAIVNMINEQLIDPSCATRAHAYDMQGRLKVFKIKSVKLEVE
jgi:hypothetical protein